MGVIKEEDIIAWQDGNRIICADCGDPGEAIPLREDDFDDGDVVLCDSCNPPHRIL